MPPIFWSLSRLDLWIAEAAKTMAATLQQVNNSAPAACSSSPAVVSQTLIRRQANLPSVYEYPN